MIKLFRRDRRYPLTRFQMDMLLCIADAMQCLADQIRECINGAKGGSNHD